MHPEAAQFVSKALARLDLPPLPQVLEIGSADVNGSLRELLPEAEWLGVDIEAAPGVDIVADARTLRLASMVEMAKARFDLCICTEVLEHVLGWEDIVETIGVHLKPGAWTIITAATEPRAMHGARSPDGTMRPGEYYKNVDRGDLEASLYKWASYTEVTVDRNHGDVYAFAQK